MDNADPTRPHWYLLKAEPEGAVALAPSATVETATADGDVILLTTAQEAPAAIRDMAIAAL